MVCFLLASLHSSPTDASEIWGALKEAKVVLMPGRAMHCRSADPSFRSPHMRVSYSNASPEDLEEGMRRLGQVLRQHAAAQGSDAKPANGAAQGSKSIALSARSGGMLLD
jgi:kynurenine/2-aminoadipate aminotransferase